MDFIDEAGSGQAGVKRLCCRPRRVMAHDDDDDDDNDDNEDDNSGGDDDDDDDDDGDDDDCDGGGDDDDDDDDGYDDGGDDDGDDVDDDDNDDDEKFASFVKLFNPKYLLEPPFPLSIILTLTIARVCDSLKQKDSRGLRCHIQIMKRPGRGISKYHYMKVTIQRELLPRNAFLISMGSGFFFSVKRKLFPSNRS